MQRCTIALRPGGDRIDLPIERLVVRDDLLQRAFRRLRSRLQRQQQERPARKCASEVPHDQWLSASRTASWKAFRNAEFSLLCAVGHTLWATITMFCGS